MAQDNIVEIKEAAEEEAVYVHTLKKPLTYDGKEYTTLTFDFASLRGSDAEAIANELQRRNIVALVPAASIQYLACMASRACKEPIGTDAFALMSLSDYNRITTKARNFLLESES